MAAIAARGGEKEEVQKLDLVRGSALAVELTGDQCAVLAQLVSVRSLADGEVLVEQGAVDDQVYVIVSGALAVARRREADGEWITLHLLSKGDLAGELGFMDGRPHYAVLRATGPTRVLCLTRQKLESLLELSAALQVIAHKTPAHAEAVNAFIEKREPKFGDE